MDPLTTAIIAGASGGAAGKFLEKTWGAGEHWLAEYYSTHGVSAMSKARDNARGFLSRIAAAIKEMQEAADADVAAKAESSLSDPDFASILRDAILASSRTPSEQKHDLLARIVAGRLSSAPDDDLSLVSAAAVHAVSLLNPEQLHYLALANELLAPVRPLDDWVVGVRANGTYQESMTGWFSARLSPHLDAAEKVELRSIQHLVAVNCIQYEAVGRRDLCKLLHWRNAEWDEKPFLATDGGQRLAKIWSDSMQHVLLTSIGALLGTYAHDQATGQRTILNW